MILILSLSTCKDFGKGDSANSSNWSAHQGRMNWADAKAKCASLGMRLPTIEELKAEYAGKFMEPWKTDGIYFWSSTPSDHPIGYNPSLSIVSRHNVPYSTNNHVRCIR